METIFFVLSATVLVCYLTKIISCCCGHEVTSPVPVLHIWEISFANTYISTPAIAFQIYFWAIYLGVLGS